MINKISNLRQLSQVSQNKNQHIRSNDKTLIGDEAKIIEQLAQELAVLGTKPSRELVESKLINIALVNMLGQAPVNEPKYKELHQHIKDELTNSNTAKTLIQKVMVSLNKQSNELSP